MAGEPYESGKAISFGFGLDQMPNMESNQELYNLTTGLEMLSFPSKNRDANSLMWKQFFTKVGANHSGGGGGGSGAGAGGASSSSDFYQTDDFNYKPNFTTTLSETTTDNLIHSSWQDTNNHHHHHHPNNNNRFVVEDHCVFPSEEGRNMRSQGLSLSLSSNKSSSSSSTIGLQTLELIRGTTSQLQHQTAQAHQQHQQIFQHQDRFMGIAPDLHQMTQIQLKDSKYLAPSQELLNEFCSLETKKTDPQNKKKMTNQWLDDQVNGSACGSSRKQLSLNSSNLDLLELQKRKSKLLSMLEEVDRRYKQYCDQMKSVVSSFEAVVGSGTGLVYSALASKAMSRHFRCLRDAIMFQIKATNKAMGDKDSVPLAPGTSKGETPRLRLLEQTHRQQRAFRQMSIMETHPWRPQRGLPERSISLLRAWLFEHFLHPYPSDVDKHILARQTGLSRSQVSNWFINARVRLWKPMVEEMYLEETKEEGDVGPSDRVTTGLGDNSCIYQNPYELDQKPTPGQLVRGDTGCLSSIINNPDDNIHVKIGRNHNHNQHQQLGRDSETFGVMDLDLSSYNDHQTSNTISYTNNSGTVHQNFNKGVVSLTLGLQQHGGEQSVGNGMNLSFSSPTQHHSLFFPRDEVEECEFSILDGGEVQNPPYRNMMGVQLLRDLAG